MKQAQTVLSIQTRRQGNSDITRQVATWVGDQAIATGLLTVFLQHISAHLTLQEHADRDDLTTFFSRFEGAPTGDYGEFTGAITAASLAIPISDGAMALGPRQRIYLHEHRENPQSRHLVLHLVGE